MPVVPAVALFGRRPLVPLPCHSSCWRPTVAATLSQFMLAGSVPRDEAAEDVHARADAQIFAYIRGKVGRPGVAYTVVVTAL